MSRHSVLLIGAGGYLGVPVAREFLHQREKFDRLAILADPSKASKFDQLKNQGVEIVIGSFTDPTSFKGTSPALLLTPIL